jgi:Fe-S cluster assembly ATP-binding protein
VLAAEAESLGVSDALLERSLNVDLSGGEKKRSDTLQMAVLAPSIAILDEIDSGLDVDALRAVSRRVETASSEGFGDSEPLGVLAITHYTRLLEELHPDFVHIFVGGRIVDSGGPDLADRLEVEGYAAWIPEEPTEGPDSQDPMKTPFDL